jgi:hypothetical protein
MTIICTHCAYESPCLCDTGKRPAQPAIVFVPNPLTFHHPATMTRLAIAYRAIGVSRRKLVFFVFDQLAHCTAEVVRHDGSIVDVPGIDVFGIWGEDASETWSGQFLTFAIHPPVLHASLKVAKRIRALWIALSLRCPRTAQAVIKGNDSVLINANDN